MSVIASILSEHSMHKIANQKHHRSDSAAAGRTHASPRSDSAASRLAASEADLNAGRIRAGSAAQLMATLREAE